MWKRTRAAAIYNPLQTARPPHESYALPRRVESLEHLEHPKTRQGGCQVCHVSASFRSIENLTRREKARRRNPQPTIEINNQATRLNLPHASAPRDKLLRTANAHTNAFHRPYLPMHPKFGAVGGSGTRWGSQHSTFYRGVRGCRILDIWTR